jgi:hypothetical protein
MPRRCMHQIVPIGSWHYSSCNNVTKITTHRRKEVVHEEIRVAPGVYEVEILDQWGDGIATFHDDSYFGFYSLTRFELVQS